MDSNTRTVVDELKKQIENSLVELKNKGVDENNQQDWINTLYQAYLQRFLSDNNRIWPTAQIMIPVSLAAFSFPVKNTAAPFLPLLVLALASFCLLLL